MNVNRVRFIIGFGAFATASVARIPRVNAQQLIEPQTDDLGNQGVLYRVRLDIGTLQPVECTAAVLPRQSFRARIIQQMQRNGAFTAVQELARGSGAQVAINGGRFNGAFQPDGLLIIDGKTIGRKRDDWIGSLTIDDAGIASVTTKPNLLKAKYAVQGFPTLIEPGGKMGIEDDDHQYYRRTVVAQSGDAIVAMVTSRVSLFALAYALIERHDVFYLHSIDAALNLSGAATTGFYAKLPSGEEVVVPSFWPNRDVVTFTPVPLA